MVAFFAGTYLPPSDRQDQIGFQSLLSLIASQWKAQREALVASGQQFVEIVKMASQKTETPTNQVAVLLRKAVDDCFTHLNSIFDSEYGGFGDAPKFPTPPILDFLLRLHFEGNAKAGQMTRETLQKMAMGGIHDHLEGGFHRYSVDKQWHLPHFEKMLYDQGQLLKTFSTAHMIYRDAIFKEAMMSIINYVQKHLTSPQGVFYSAEDADSKVNAESTESKEGAFAVWNVQELRKILSEPRLFEAFGHYYGVHEKGNVYSKYDPHGDLKGMNVLDHLAGQAASRQDILLEAKERVKEARKLRPRPSLDNKILCSWNALMISGLCRAYRSLDFDESILRMAREAINSILQTNYDRKSKILGRTFSIKAFADDYTFLIAALIDMYEISLNQEYMSIAEELQEQLDEACWSPNLQAYTIARKDSADITLNLPDDYDGAEPSANSVALMNLSRLDLLSDNEQSSRYRARKNQVLTTFSKHLEDVPIGMPALLDAYLFDSKPPNLIVLEGASRDDIGQFHKIALRHMGMASTIKAIINSTIVKPSAHVCRGTTCSEKALTSSDLVNLLT